MAHQRINGISLYYEVHGQGHPLMLISGLGGDHTFWQASLPVLAAHFQVIVYDTRGIGQTDAPEGPYSMAVLAEDLVALLDALHLPKAHLLGFSMGGQIAQAFALAYPDRVEKLILAATFARMNAQARLFLDAVLSVYEGGCSAKQMYELILPWLLSSAFLSHPANADYLVFDDADPYPQSRQAWRAQYDAQRQYCSLSALPGLQLPTLVLAGAQDRLVPIEDGQLLASRIPNAQLVILPDSGHLINYEQADLFHQCILQFLA